MLFCAAVALQSCKDDDDPTFRVGGAEIEADGYTAEGTLRLLYSVDDGGTFTATVPTDVKPGTKVLVKVNNGTSDLSDADFSFDWSGSTPAPSNVAGDIAEFTFGSNNASINVEVADLWSLVSSHRNTGKFYSLDKTNGDSTEIFTVTFDGGKLSSVRGFVYHYNQKSFYASVNTDVGGYLYKIAPVTKVATRINENNGSDDHDVWDAIVNWAVAPDDSLIAVGDFNDDGNGIVKFGTDGGRSSKTTVVDICCGLGMLYDATASELLVGNGWESNDGEIIIDVVGLDGEITDSHTITNFEGFPTDFSEYWLTLKAMAKDKDGVIYGILFNDGEKDSFLVKIDLAAGSISYVSTLGTDNANQFNTLVFLPNYTF